MLRLQGLGPLGWIASVRLSGGQKVNGNGHCWYYDLRKDFIRTKECIARSIILILKNHRYPSVLKLLLSASAYIQDERT
jgi:hypothetical protein